MKDYFNRGKEWLKNHSGVSIAIVGVIITLIYYLKTRNSSTISASTMDAGGGYLPTGSTGSGGSGSGGSSGSDTTGLLSTITNGFANLTDSFTSAMKEQEQANQDQYDTLAENTAEGMTTLATTFKEAMGRVEQPPGYVSTPPGVSNGGNNFADIADIISPTGKTNQQNYLDDLIETGDAGQKAWAKNESQKTYLGNLVKTGDAGQKAWATDQLSNMK